MKTIGLIIFFTAIIFAYGQNNAVKGGEEKKNEYITYKLKTNFKVNTFYTAKVTEQTEVKRIYPDSTTKEYTRTIDYYLTTQMREQPKDGFQTLVVTIDSLIYSFKDGEASFEFNSNNLSGKAARFKDLNYKTSALGRTFEMTYSPYGEVAEITGYDIEDALAYVKDQGTDYLKPIDMFIWTNGLSKEHLEYLGDIKKISVPTQRMAIDSIWKSPFIFEINGYNIEDTLDMKIESYNTGDFVLKGNSTAFKTFDREFFTYDARDLVPIINSKAEGEIEISLQASGYIEKFIANYNAFFRLKVGEQYILENVNTKYDYSILKRFRL